MPSCSATCAAGQPWSRTRPTRSCRLKTLSLGLGWDTREPSLRLELDTPTGARGLSCCQRRVWGLHLAPRPFAEHPGEPFLLALGLDRWSPDPCRELRHD